MSQEIGNPLIIHIPPKTHDIFATTLDRYFQKRYLQFVVKRGWKVPHVNGRELDQFDTQETTHIVWEENDQVIGGARLLQTHRPYLLGDVFHSLLEGPAPKDPDIWEISRLFIDLPDSFNRSTTPAVRKLFLSIFDFGCIVNAKKFIALTEPSIESIMRHINIPWERTSHIHISDEGAPMVTGETPVTLHICNEIRKTLPDNFISSWTPITPELLRLIHSKSNNLTDV